MHISVRAGVSWFPFSIVALASACGQPGSEVPSGLAEASGPGVAKVVQGIEAEAGRFDDVPAAVFSEGAWGATAPVSDDAAFGICVEGRPASFERCSSGLDADCDGLTDRDDPDCGLPGIAAPEMCEIIDVNDGMLAVPLDDCVADMLAARALCHELVGCTLVSKVYNFSNGIAGTEACWGNGNHGVRAWRCTSDPAQDELAL